MEMGVSRPDEHIATVPMIGFDGSKGSNSKDTMIASKSTKASGSRLPVALLSIPLRGTQVGAVYVVREVLAWLLVFSAAAIIPPLPPPP